MLHINSKPIVEKAQIGNLNLSSIFSELITAAAVCEYYASDVFYDLKAIEKAIENAENESVFYIGFRNSGVDGKNFVKSRLAENEYYKYIRLYRLEISVSDGDITAKLKRVDEYTAYKELCEEG